MRLRLAARRAGGGAGLLLAAGLLIAPGGCAGRGRDVVTVDVPFVQQPEDRCGTAAVAMILAHYGASPDFEALDRDIHLPALSGSIPELLADAARRRGFSAGLLRDGEAELRQRLAAGQPLILLLAPSGEEPRGHFVVATGYQTRRGALRVHSGMRPDRWWTAGAWRPRWEAAGSRGVWILPVPADPPNLPAASGQGME